MERTCYEILGIDKNVSEIEIRRKYKQLVKQYHPDRNKDSESKRKFIQIQNAYNELINPSPPTFLGIPIYIVNKCDFENYEDYRWAFNKMTSLRRLHFYVFIWLERKEKENIPFIVNHLEKVLKKEEMEKMPPKHLKGTHTYKICNQFHPKFINKFPVKYQKIIFDMIREFVLKLKDTKEE